MNVKQKIKVGVLGAMVIVGMTAVTSSAVDCTNATVTKVGILPAYETTTVSKYMVRVDCLDDGTTDALPWAGERQFMLSQEMGDSGYATLLTAISLDQPVYIRVESTSWWSMSTLLYLSSPPAP